MASQAEKDAIARGKGFKNWEQYVAWETQRSKKTGGTAEGAGKRGQRVVARGNDDTGLTKSPGGKGNALSWHPATLLNHVAEKMKSARKGR